MIIIIGRSLDKFGPRIMLVAVTVLTGTGAIYMSRVETAWQLLIGFAVMRTMGQGALSLIPATMVSVWFVRRRAMALAIMALGGATAAGAFPLFGATLIDAFGWRTAWIAIGITAWTLLILPAAVLVRRSPESVGLLPDGVKTAEESSSTTGERSSSSISRSWTLRQAIRARALWLIMFAGIAQSLIGTGVMFHQVEIMTDKGLSHSVAAGVFGVVAPALLVGQFISGYLAGRFAERYLIAIGQVLIVLNMLLLVVVSEPWHAYMYGATLGLNMGFLMNSMQSVWPVYFGRQNLGSIRGVTNFGTMAAAAIGPLPLAAAFDLTGTYTLGLAIYMALPPVCAVAALFAGSPGTPPSLRGTPVA